MDPSSRSKPTIFNSLESLRFPRAASLAKFPKFIVSRFNNGANKKMCHTRPEIIILPACKYSFPFSTGIRASRLIALINAITREAA